MSSRNKWSLTKVIFGKANLSQSSIHMSPSRDGLFSFFFLFNRLFFCVIFVDFYLEITEDEDKIEEEGEGKKEGEDEEITVKLRSKSLFFVHFFACSLIIDILT